MSRLTNLFHDTILNIGMNQLEQPVFYNAPVGLRFEIGGEDSVYLENTQHCIANPAYIRAAFERALSIYGGLPHPPTLLRIDGYPSTSGETQKTIQTICSYANLPLPHEQFFETYSAEDADEAQIGRLQLYWNLSIMEFLPDQLLLEIIRGDIGGYSGFVSNVYFLDECSSILYHLYDDRGLDIVAADKATIRPLYERFNDWILDYDRETISHLFPT